MTYLKVDWIHSFEREPVEMLSELDDSRNEIRKVERYRDGTLHFAGSEGASGSTVLSEAPLPDLKEIAADPQFQATTIGKDVFELCWKTATMSVAA